MALTLDQLKRLVEGEKLKYFVHPERPTLLLVFGGLHGKYQVAFSLELEGKFLQFRTAGYAECGSDHPHLPEVLKVLGHLNYQKRLVKFGWDPSDGEIMAYADAWIVDGTLTQAQFSRMVSNYVPTIDFASQRIQETLKTGTDPGEKDPAEVISGMLGGDLPEPLRKLLEKIKGKKIDAV